MASIEQRVMASVGVIYTVRQLVSATALKLYVAALALWGVGQLVWVSRVFQNLAEVGMEGAATFVMAAFVNAEFAVQLTLVVLAVAGVSLVRDLLKPVQTLRPAL